MKKTVKNLITWSPSHLITSQKSAFTLAEVLITLAIIGVVAAMTIPTLITNYKEKATVTKVKKAYSVINSSIKLATVEHGTIDNWGLIRHSFIDDEENPKIYTDETIASADRFVDYITENLKVVKRCTYEECGRNGAYGGSARAYFQDGTFIRALSISRSDCGEEYGAAKNVCGDLYIGIIDEEIQLNGVNTFVFWITKDGLVPQGVLGDSRRENNCLGVDITDRRGCTAWVIEHGNMDYLHCNDLSWDDKHKCSN